MDKQTILVHRASAGFTLIELMITVVIAAILVGIAVPSYKGHLVKARRATAAACMMDYAQLMERAYSANFSFDFDIDGDTNPEQENETLSRSCSTELSNYYSFSFASLTGSTYVLQAAPTAAQSDADCATLKLDQSGARSVTGTADKSDCW